MNFWDILNNHEAETTAHHSKYSQDFQAAKASYVPPVFESKPVAVVEVTPTQQKIIKSEQRKAEAKSQVFSVIRRMRNQGMSADEIYSACKNDRTFIRTFGKHMQKQLPVYVSLSDQWDEHKNRVEIFYNLLCHVYQASQSRKIQKDTKRLAPLMLLIPSLTTALAMNRTAISATRYVRNVGSSIALSDELLEPNQDRKWKAYQKLKFIDYIKGKAGGDSNRVEILPYEGPVLSVDQKLKAAQIILDLIQHPAMKSKLSAVLLDIASSEDSPRYDNCDLTNKVEDLLAEFAPIAGQVVSQRKAERLVESVEFEEAIQAEADEVTEKVTALLKAGYVLVSAGHVEAPQIHAEPLTYSTPTPDGVWLDLKTKRLEEGIQRFHDLALDIEF